MSTTSIRTPYHNRSNVQFNSYFVILSKKEMPKKLLALFEKRVILSAGAMLIFSVSFQIDQMPEGNSNFGGTKI